MADIPGLIEGAHDGAGLGLEFLRHVERTRLLIHVVDASQPDPAHDIDVIDNELRSYVDDLGTRPQIIAFNKMDIPEAEARRDGAPGARRPARPPVRLHLAPPRARAPPSWRRRAFERLERIREDEPQPGSRR